MGKTLLHGLFPAVRAEVLQLLFTNPQELYVRELARLSFLSLQTVQDELAKLEAADLISSRSNGYHRFYRANPKHPLYATLRRMLIRGAAHPKPAAPPRGKQRPEAADTSFAELPAEIPKLTPETTTGIVASRAFASWDFRGMTRARPHGLHCLTVQCKSLQLLLRLDRLKRSS